MAHHDDSPSFLARLGLAFRLLGNAEAAAKASRALQEQPAPAPLPAPVAPAAPAAAVATPAPAPKPETDHSAGLLLLGLLQRQTHPMFVAEMGFAHTSPNLRIQTARACSCAEPAS